MVIAVTFGLKFLLVYQIFDAFILYVLKAIHWFSGFEALMNKNLSLSLLEMAALFLLVYFLKFLIKDVSSLKQFLRFSFSILLFFGLRISFNAYHYEKKEVLVHSFYKDKIISVKDKNHIVFWLKENKNEEKIRDFVINPYLISRRAEDYQINYYSEDADAFVFEEDKYDLK
jgi:competence protein ComEC